MQRETAQDRETNTHSWEITMKRSWWSYERIYEDMGEARRISDLEKRLARFKYLFIAVITVWIAGAGSLFFYLFRHWQNSAPPTPLLSGSPQITLLALIIGLSAYFRQVRSNAVSQRDRAAGGQLWNYPIHGKYAALTKRKLTLLDKTSLMLTMASPLFIVLFVVLSLRAVFDAVDHIKHYLHGALILAVGDVVILTWVLFAFGILSVTHFVSRTRDDRIRAVSRAFEDEFRMEARGHCESTCAKRVVEPNEDPE
jgi:hypothetical protein